MSTSFAFPPNPVIGQFATLPNGTIAQWNGTEWVSVSNTDVTYPIAITLGGTGATTAAQARINLGISGTEAFKLFDGTVAAPGLAFASQPGLGWFRFAADIIATANGGGLTSYLHAAAASTILGLAPRAVGSSEYNVINAPNGSANFNTIRVTAGQAQLSIIAGKSGTASNLPMEVSNPYAGLYLRSTDTVFEGVSGGNATATLNKSASGMSNILNGKTAGVPRWALILGDAGTESGSSAGSAFALYRYNDVGAYLGNTFSINRADGTWSVSSHNFAITGFTSGQDVYHSLNSVGAGNVGYLINKGDASKLNFVRGMSAGVPLWDITIGAVGNNDFQIDRYAGGAFAGTALSVQNSTGKVTMVTNNQAVTLQVADFGGSGSNLVMSASGGQKSFRVITNSLYVVNNANNAYIFSMSDVGACQAQSFTPMSDERLKRSIMPLQMAQDAFMAIKPISFRWKEGDDAEHWGFSAQNLKPLMAPAVVGEFDTVREDGFPSPVGLDPVAVQAQTVLMVQDLINRVRQLENQA